MTGWRKRQVMEMAREADLIDDTSASDWYVYQLERFAELVASAEREACANIAHQWSKREDDVGGYIEAAIRARGGQA